MTAPAGFSVLVTTDAVGGVWSHALDLAGGLAARGVRVTLAVLGPPTSAAQRRAAAGVPGLVLHETRLPLDWLADGPEEVEQAGRGIAGLARAEGADLVQLNSPALAAAARFHCPVVGVCHSCLASWWQVVRGGAMPDAFLWRTALLARGYRAADTLVAPTRAYAQATAAAHGLARPPRVVPNGVHPGPRGDRLGGFVLGAGRLWDDGKDFATLDRAAARLDIPVLAAGPARGPDGRGFVPRRLRMLGELDRAALREWMLRGPVFVSAARYEPFGLAVLEAAQAGCALVLSDIPTFRELWDGVALFAPPGDDAAFAAAVTALRRDEARRRALAHGAAARARGLTADAMAEGMFAIQAALLRRAGPGRETAA